MAQATRDLGRGAVLATGPGAVAAEWPSVRAFCQAEGVNEPQFYWWRRKLGRVEPKEPAFVPVHVVTEDASAARDRGDIEVVLANGRCLRVGPGFDPHTLVTLVDLLEARGPSC